MAKADNDPELAPLIQAQAQLDAAKKTYNEKVSQAKSSLRQATKAHDGLVGVAKDKLDAENKRWDSPIGSLGEAQLFYSRLVIGRDSLDLRPDMSTSVATEQSDVTLTVTSGGRSLSLHCPEKDLSKARDFSDQIRQVASEAEANAAAHEKNVAVLTQNLDQITADTTQIDQAQKDLDYATSQQGPIQAASLRVSEARSHINPDVLKKYDQRGRKKNSSMAVIIILAILLVVMVVLYSIVM